MPLIYITICLKKAQAAQAANLHYRLPQGREQDVNEISRHKFKLIRYLFQSKNVSTVKPLVTDLSLIRTVHVVRRSPKFT